MKQTYQTKTGLSFVVLSSQILLIVIILIGLAAPTRAAGGLASEDGPQGGTILSGPLPKVLTGPAAFKAGLHLLHGYFDKFPTLIGVVCSKDKAVTIAPFRAVRQGAPVSGIALATYDPAGHSRFAVMYDDPTKLGQSLPPMMDRLKVITQDALEKARPVSSGAAGPDFAAYEAAAAHVSLHSTSFPDGTATIGVADGFTPGTMSGGRFSASAADGAYANLYIPISLMDPSGSLYQQEMQMSGGNPPQIPGQTVIAYDADPIVAWKKVLTERANERGSADPDPQILHAAPLPNSAGGFTGKMVAGTMTLNGEPYVFSGTLLISPPPGADGGWLLQITMRAAPTAHASTDMPALIAMQNSEKVDMNAVRDQTMRNIKAMSEETARWLALNKIQGDAARDHVFETSMHNAQVAQDNIDISAAAFIHYINDTTVVQQNSTGAQATVSTSMAAALQSMNPAQFQQVPVSQFTKGVNY